MSTRSAIIEKTSDGKYRGIYCHHDGYPSHVGMILASFYNTPEKVQELMSLGDLSSLAETLTNTFAYMRDRGETDCEAFEADSLSELLEAINHEYYYVFENGKWTCDGKSFRIKKGKSRLWIG